MQVVKPSHAPQGAGSRAKAPFSQQHHGGRGHDAKHRPHLTRPGPVNALEDPRCSQHPPFIHRCHVWISSWQMPCWHLDLWYQSETLMAKLLVQSSLENSNPVCMLIKHNPKASANVRMFTTLILCRVSLCFQWFNVTCVFLYSSLCFRPWVKFHQLKYHMYMWYFCWLVQ